MADEPTDWVRNMLDAARVGHLATASAAAEPHVVAVCFVLIGERIYTPIDEKPKSGRILTRVRNVRATSKAALLVDRYDEDWRHLAWVQARGIARIVQPGDASHLGVIEALREKYPQYRAMSLASAELIELRIERWRSWRWTSD